MCTQTATTGAVQQSEISCNFYLHLRPPSCWFSSALRSLSCLFCFKYLAHCYFLVTCLPKEHSGHTRPLKILPSVQMKFYYWLAIVENSKRDQPSGKNLIGPFLPCSEYALFDGQLNCPRPALGKTEIFESPVLTTPSLKARPATWCPQGDPGTLSENSAKL